MFAVYTAHGRRFHVFSFAGYTPPNLAISTLYWRAWMMLLMLTAHNPGSLGAEAWNHYPILRSLMEMCITNDFSSLSTLSDPQELQVAAIEKQQILEFETHLAAASTKAVITENNSLLLSQVGCINLISNLHHNRLSLSS